MADGVAVLQPDGSKVRGVVRFIDEMGGLRITYRVTGLTDGEHGFHIHEYGDLTDGCKSACAHFNPDGMTHGGLDTTVRHFGDLGNITSSDGVAEGKLFLDKGRLNTSNYGILGRMIIVHADRDDLGKGGDEESLKTGNAGKRLACGVIGLADPDTDTMTMDAEDILPRKCRECGTTENITTIQTGTFCFDCLPINLGAEEFAAEDNYDSTYGKEQAKIRRRLKNKLMGEATMGTKAGEWSARKSQELKRRYEAACERKGIRPYKGSKTTKQKDLSNWSKQGWRTASGRKSSVTGEPYFPAKAVKALKDKELYAKAKRQKAAATRAGKQRATYSKDIQAVVARYRAEDHTIDDLDSDSLVTRMDAIGILLDEIVQKHGGSYENAERDPIYLRLVAEHTALARAYARREGFGAEDFTITEPPMDIKEEAQARLEAIRQLQWGIRAIERMLREGNIDEAREFARITVEAMQQEEDASRDLGLDPDRFSAESDASFTPDPDLPLTKQARDQYLFMMPDGSALWIHNQDWSVSMADMKPTWDSKRLSDYGGTPTTVTYMSLGSVDPADYTDFIPEWRPGMSFPPEDMVDQWIDPSRLGEAHDELTKQYETGFWPGLSLREILGKYDGGKPVFEAESDAIMAFRYMPESAYHRALEKGYMEPYGDHGATLATIDPTPTFYQTDGFYDGGHPLSDIYQIDLTGLQYRHHQVSAPQGQVILIEGDIPVDQIQPLSYSYANDGFSAESDPVSSVAAGTTDALNDFANSQDTDDKFYFIGGLIGGLAIAVLGNIISDRLQDVYFPHWWENRGGSKS